MSLLVPDGLAYLPFQEEGIEFCLVRSCILGDDMGLGKTIQAIGVINNNLDLKRVLVICPASLKLNWESELRLWLTRPLRVGVVGLPLDPNQDASRDTLIAIVNYESIVKYKDRLCRTPWDLLICDEAQFMKNPDAQRTRAVLGYRGRKKKFSKEPPIPYKQILFLTGTPILNAPVELWPMLQVLDPQGLGRAYWPYVNRYCGPYRSRYGMKVNGMTNGPELHALLIERNIMLRRLKSKVLPQLPPKTRQIIPLPATGKVRALIKVETGQYDEYRAFIASDTRSKDQKRIAFEEMSTARKNVAIAKVPEVRKLIELGMANGPVVCFAHHRDVIDALGEGYKHVTLTGSSSVHEREHAVRAFQAGKCDLFLGNIKAAGVGITLTRSAHVIFGEIDWTPAIMLQAEDRCHRIGQHNPLLIQLPVLEDSLDHRIAATLVKKQRMVNTILDGE